MTSGSHGAFAAALSGSDGRVVQVPHPRVTFLAQNANGTPALLASVDLAAGQTIEQGRGFSVSTARSADERFVRIVSSERGLNLLFLKLVDHILERTATARDSQDAARLLVEAIDEFRRFFGRKPGLLSEEQVRGLVAELHLLLRLRDGDPQRTWDVFHSWGGPFGAPHDFEFASGAALEVKSTHRPPTEVRISGPEQLQPLADGLELLVLPLERVADSAEADVSLVHLVREVDGIAREHGGDVLEVWESALDALRLDITDEYYTKWNFRCGEWMRYSVVDGFPTIRSEDVPHGVFKVAFSVAIEALEPYSLPFDEMEIGP